MSGAGKGIRRLVAAGTAVVLAGLGLAVPASAASGGGFNAFVTDSRQNQVYVIDTATNAITATVPVGANPHGLAVLPDGSRVYVADHGSAQVSVIDSATAAVVATIPVTGAPNFVTSAPDGKHVYVSNDGTNSLNVIDTATNTVTATVQVGSVASGVAVITPDGKAVFVASTNAGTVYKIDTASNSVTATIPTPHPSALAVSPDGSELAVVDAVDHTVSRFATGSGALSGTTAMVGSPQEMAYTQGVLYVTDDGGTVSVLDHGVITHTIAVSTRVLGGIAATPDGASLYVGNYFGNGVSVLDTASNSVSTVIPTPDSSQPYEVAIGNRSADLSVKLTANPAGLLVHEVTFTATVKNNGPGAATAATVKFSYANGFVSPSAPGCTVDAGARTATCDLGAVANGTSVAKSLKLTVGLLTISGSMPVTATRTASSPTDGNAANDSSTVTCSALTSILVSC
jgi:YVTN family beta-propeller protein